MIKDVFIMLASIMALVLTAIFIFFMVMILDSCTLNISNVESYGKSELEEQTEDKNDVTTNLTIPKLW